jgi:hypothetical protein
MVVHYTNRIAKTNYLREGKTKTGKPRYFFSPQKHGKGEEVYRIPDGYEIYEHPENAQVFLRKMRPQLITDLEKLIVTRLLRHCNAQKGISSILRMNILRFMNQVSMLRISKVSLAIYWNIPRLVQNQRRMMP